MATQRSGRSPAACVPGVYARAESRSTPSRSRAIVSSSRQGAGRPQKPHALCRRGRRGRHLERRNWVASRQTRRTEGRPLRRSLRCGIAPRRGRIVGRHRPGVGRDLAVSPLGLAANASVRGAWRAFRRIWRASGRAWRASGQAWRAPSSFSGTARRSFPASVAHIARVELCAVASVATAWRRVDRSPQTTT